MWPYSRRPVRVTCGKTSTWWAWRTPQSCRRSRWALSHCWMFFICNETSTRSKQHTRRELEQREREWLPKSILSEVEEPSVDSNHCCWLTFVVFEKKLRLNTFSPTPHWPSSEYILTLSTYYFEFEATNLLIVSTSIRFSSGGRLCCFAKSEQ